MLWASLPDNQRNKLELRLYKGFPSVNIEVIDEGKPSQYIMVEMFPYRCGFRNRPQMIVKPATGGWYKSLLERIKLRWEDAHPLEPT